MKRILSGIVACTLILTSIAGCSPKAVKSQPAPSSTPGAESTGALPSDQEESSQTIRWINTTYALLTTANEGDITKIGGFEKTEENTIRIRELLNDSWGVTDRPSADDTVNWLITEGHRKSFQDEMNMLKEDGVISMSPEDAQKQLTAMDMTEEQAACYLAMMDAYQKYGDNTIDAWDYCRALQLLGWYYIADYYTLEETMDKSLEVAKTLQSLYSSWDGMVDSYLTGYNYWAEDDPAAPDSPTAARRAIYDNLKSSKENPYQQDWNMDLQKSW